MDRENVNNITSIYGLDNATAWLRNQTQAGKAFYVFDKKRDKKRADTFLQTYGYLATVGETNSSNSVTIPQPTTEVKTKNSARDVDLQSKYPQLDLNEDISELDGVPAIELVDGSILPITDRSGRYPTHVSFIEANRIDVDDLKSGGWIGNGVYDSSFQSDTARYIERESARKRVAELTGKPYSQFEKTRYSMRDVATNDTAQQRREREKSYADLKRRSAELERQIENLRGQMKRTTQATIRKADTDKLAVRLAKDMGLTDRSVIADVKKELQELGDFIVQSTGEELGYTDLKELALDIADHALNNAEIELDNGTRDILCHGSNEEIIVHGSRVLNSENELVHKETNKNDTSTRTIPIMIPRLKEIIPDEADYLITCGPNTLTERINSLCRKNDLPEVGLHGLRRSFASLAHHLKWDVRTTMHYGGWSDYKTVNDFYIKLDIKLDKSDLILEATKMVDFYSGEKRE